MNKKKPSSRIIRECESFLADIQESMQNFKDHQVGKIKLKTYIHKKMKPSEVFVDPYEGRNKIRIFIDLDGVCCNTDDAITPLMKDFPVINPKATSPWERYDASGVWQAIDQFGTEEFFATLPMYSWTRKMVEFCQKHGEVAFLTSPGDLRKGVYNSARASSGKHFWVAEHFPTVPLIVTKNKYLLANKRSILIDDLKKNIDAFDAYGGSWFWFDSGLQEKSTVKELCKKLKAEFDDMEKDSNA